MEQLSFGTPNKRNLMEGDVFCASTVEKQPEMLPPKGEWTKFTSEEDRQQHLKLWGFPQKPTVVIYSGFYTERKKVFCDIVGYKEDSCAVIQVGDRLHCIHGEYLFEMQANKHTKYEGMPKDYVVFDVETTSKYVTYAEIIEIAAIKYIDGKEAAVFETLIKPKKHIPKEVVELTGITDEDVADAPQWKDIQEQFFAFIGNLPLVGHNVLYDIGVVQNQSKRWFDNPYVDTYQRAKTAFPKGQELTERLGIVNYKLEHLKERLCLNAGVSHRALADVRTTNALLLACEYPTNCIAARL